MYQIENCHSIVTYRLIDQIEKDPDNVTHCPLLAERLCATAVHFFLLEIRKAYVDLIFLCKKPNLERQKRLLNIEGFKDQSTY